jgi:hypothetical protein
VGTPLSTASAKARILLIVAALPLAGCANDAAKVEDNPYPADYRKVVVNMVTNDTSIDPVKIRDAAISVPVLRPVENVSRYVSCVRYSPRNPQHEYEGTTERIIYFFQGHVTSFVQATREQCSFADYRPFPELEKICLADKCN